MVAADIPELVEEFVEAADCEGARCLLRTEEASMTRKDRARLWELIRSKEQLLETARLDAEV